MSVAAKPSRLHPMSRRRCWAGALLVGIIEIVNKLSLCCSTGYSEDQGLPLTCMFRNVVLLSSAEFVFGIKGFAASIQVTY
jgi:hypothetical protein